MPILSEPWMPTHLLRLALVTIFPPPTTPHNLSFLATHKQRTLQQSFSLSSPAHLSQKAAHPFICSSSRCARASFSTSDLLLSLIIIPLPSPTFRLRVPWRPTRFHIHIYIDSGYNACHISKQLKFVDK